MNLDTAVHVCHADHCVLRPKATNNSTKKKITLSETTMTGATGKSPLPEATIPNVLETRPSSHPVISTLIGSRVKSRR